jgi:hypothetical protein
LRGVPRLPKRRGEWAELKFMTEAAARGLELLKPYGDSARYDFVVATRTRFHRVQVKCTSAFEDNAYLCSYFGGSRAYSPRQIDFLAAYIIPRDIWYIIPAASVLRGRQMISLYPHRPPSTGRYEKFREAWRLLLD